MSSQKDQVSLLALGERVTQTLPGYIPVAGPWITDKEVAYVAEAAREAWYANAGTYTERFERAFADHLGRRFAISLPSCTSGIHLSLVALGIGPGDEVVVPDCTWIASAAPISYVGATTVFADVDPQTWCLSAESLAGAITPRTRAVIPVDLYGGMPDMAAIQAVAAAHGIAVIEDAAQAIGSSYRGRPAGSFGNTSVFSFHGSKTLTTGEGGMVVTDDAALYARMRVLCDHGREPGDVSFTNAEVAFKYKMSSVQAALGQAQLERLDELVGKKRQIFSWYQQGLGQVPGLMLNVEPAGIKNSYWMSTIVWPASWALSKAELADRLAAQGIGTRPFFHPLSSLPAYAASPHAQGARAANPVAYALGPNGLNLPSALSLERSDVEAVVGALLAILPVPADQER